MFCFLKLSQTVTVNRTSCCRACTMFIYASIITNTLAFMMSLSALNNTIYEPLIESKLDTYSNGVRL